MQVFNEYPLWFKAIDKAMALITDLLDVLISQMEVFMHKSTRRITIALNKLEKAFLDYLYKPLRYISMPGGFVFVKIWEVYKDLYIEPDLLKADGVHVVMASMGEGKTSIVFQTAEELFQTKGYGSYVTAKIEKPKKDAEGDFFNHKFFQWDEIIGVKELNDKKIGYQKARFNSFLFPNRIYDEMSRFLNPRENRARNYMIQFKVIIDDMLINRHEGTKRIWLISQLTTDIQFMKVATYVHIPHMIKGVNYFRWLKTGKFEIVPLKWKVNTYQPNLDGKLVLMKRWTKRVNMDILDGFETHAEKHHRSNIPFLT